MHDQNSKPTQVNTVYLFIIKQGGTPVKRWCEYFLLERLIIMFATFMLYLCIWIWLDVFPSIGSSIQSSVSGGISSLCKPCGFSRLFGHLWWQGLLQAGEWWWPMKQYDGCVSFSTLHLPGLWRHESSEGSCSWKAESSWQFSAVAKASRHLLSS